MPTIGKGLTMKKLFHGLLDSVSRRLGVDAISQIAIDQELRRIRAEIRAVMPQNPAVRGFKVYSQIDEDGIIEAIFDDIGTKTKFFVEVGAGNGLENNSHYLLHKGWRGVWVEGDPAQVEEIKAGCKRAAADAGDLDLCVYNGYVTSSNIDSILGTCLAPFGLRPEARPEIDLLSMDIDGNDLPVLSAISVVRPRVICAEYNPKFPPPLSLEGTLDDGESWSGDDFYGASLQAFTDRLEKRGYTLVCCNASGNNAFFVESSALARSPLVVYEPRKLYQEARYHLVRKRSGHRASLAYLARRNVRFLSEAATSR